MAKSRGPTVPRDDESPSSAPRLKVARVAAPPSASRCLERALRAKTPELRVKQATLGLGAPCDTETQALLLRQLYLGELELGELDRARVVAEQLVALDVLGDVARHDAARVCQALGDHDAAIEHLRAAERCGPPDRRSFHVSTLAGLLYAIGRPRESADAISTVVDDAGSAGPLLRAQLALARHAASLSDDFGELSVAYHELARAPSGEGYGRFVLGELAWELGDRESARRHLETFLGRIRRARVSSQIALGPELRRAESLLARIAWN